MNMNLKILLVALVPMLALGALVQAAPVPSIPSSQATTARQSIDAFLGQEPVVEALRELGLSRTTIEARLAQLDDAQLEALAAEVALLQAGGAIQHGNVYPDNPFASIFRPLGRLFHNIYQFLFCWGKTR